MQYGGNISAVKWQQGTAAAQTYRFTYDGFNRLLSGTHSRSNDESQTYDPNGNMLTIARTGDQAGTLGIAYTGNQISKVNNGQAYGYDANGNTTFDALRNMNFTYNGLNLPQTISKDGQSLAYGYSADGSKREKKFNGTITQYYRKGMVYDGSGTPEYVITPEGMVRNTSGSWVRQHNLTDYLGNTRAVLAPTAGVSQQADYYPFGTAFAIANTNKNKYLYGGKELQDETIGDEQLNLYDFEARFMDTRIPRFTSIDPLAEKYYSVSPYVYCNNNPMRFIDPTGEGWYWYNEKFYVEGIEYTKTVYKYSEDYNSQEDLNNAGVEGTFVELKFSKDGNYYSLLGEIFDMNTLDGKIVERLDASIDAMYKAEYKNKNPYTTEFHPSGVKIDIPFQVKGYSTNYFYLVKYGSANLRYYQHAKSVRGAYSSGSGKYERLAASAYAIDEGYHAKIEATDGQRSTVMTWTFHEKDNYESTKRKLDKMYKNKKW